MRLGEFKKVQFMSYKGPNSKLVKNYEGFQEQSRQKWV